MKSRCRSVIGLATVIIVSFLLIQKTTFGKETRYRFETLGQAEVEKKWGKIPFNAEKFKGAPINDRAPLVASLIEQKKTFFGKSVDEIRKIFGDPDGFYHLDWNPAYLIHEAADKSDSTWQIVFLVDKNFLVTDIITHKNCCY